MAPFKMVECCCYDDDVRLERAYCLCFELGRYKQWNGLLEWKTGLDYWTELFSFFGEQLFLYFQMCI